MKNLFNIAKNSRPIAGLDCLRTLAIVGVTLFHIFPTIVQGGYLGVALFFVLSGFLLAYTCTQSWQAGKFSLAEYYLKRIRRIYPSLLLVLTLSLGVFSLTMPKVLDGMRQELLSIILGYNNWWQITQDADYFTRLANNSPFTHLWFLGIELQYYFIWPFIFLLYMWLQRSYSPKTGFVCLAVITLAAACWMPLMYNPAIDVTRLYYGTDTRIYALLLGALLGFAYYEQPKGAGKISQRSAQVLMLAALALTLAAYLLLDGRNPLVYQGGMLAMTLVFCILLYVLTHSEVALSPLVENKIFTWIGRKSYAIFLWQYPVLYLFRHLHWTAVPGYALAEISVILLLSLWSDWFTATLTKKGKLSEELKVNTVRGLVLILLCLGSIGLIGRGCYGMALASPKTKKELQAELQAQLAAKAEALARQREQEKAQAEAKKKAVAATMQGVICVGDSVMLQASQALHKQLPGCYVDAEISRYVSGGQEVIHRLKAEGRLSKVVVISLGTNGPIAGAERYEVQTLGLIKDLGDDIHIFWVNIYGEDIEWTDSNNKYLEKLAAEHPNFTIIDWHSAAAKHKEWLDQDEVHPTEDGSVHYAELIRSSIEKKLLEVK